jgi:DNA-binding response OmpR family regulator
MTRIGTAVLQSSRASLAHPGWLEPVPRRMRPLMSVLLIEHRDEVFARLESDLRLLGCQVFRASRPEDVLHIHINVTIDVTISNAALPNASVWLTAAKLRMFDRTARIWLYAVKRSIRDHNWAALSGIEKVIHYDGDLFKLSEWIGMLLPSSQVRSNS